MKRILTIFLSALLAASTIVSCSGTTPQTTDPVTDPVTDVSTDKEQSLTIFEADDSIMFENGMIKNVDGDKEKIILSTEKYEASNTFDFKFSFESRSAMLGIYFDVKEDDDGSISSCKLLRLDALNGKFNLFSVEGEEQTLLGYAKYPFRTKTEYTVRLRNLYNSVSVYFGIDEMESAPIIDVNCKRAAKAKIGICFNGSTKASISEPEIVRSSAPSEDARYKNPMLESVVIADPTVFFHDGTYYMFTTGSFVCRTSKDLVNWNNGSAVADTKELYGTKYFGGPGIYERDGIFYLIYTSHQTETSGLTTFYATSDNVLGPYRQTGTMQEHILQSKNSPAGSFLFNDPVTGNDILYFYRTDPGVGNVLYGINVSVKDGRITMKDKEPTKLTEPTEAWEKKKENGVSTPVCERPNVMYRDGYYYVFYAGSHYKTSYSEGYIVSDKPLTDFDKPKDTNPLLDATASITGVGCTWIVPSPDESELFVLYHCHDSVDSFRKRRLCMDNSPSAKIPMEGLISP